MSGNKTILTHINLHISRNPVELTNQCDLSRSRHLFQNKWLLKYKNSTNPHTSTQHLLHQMLHQMMSNILCQLYSLLLPNISQLHLSLHPTCNHPTGNPSSSRPVTTHLDGVHQFPPSIHLRGEWS